MKPSSAKAKGRTHQQRVAKDIREAFGLDPRDVVSTSMGANGADIKLSKAAFEKFPYAVECKSLATFIGYRYLAQAEEHSKAEGGVPIAVVKQNHAEPVVVIAWRDFLALTQEVTSE